MTGATGRGRAARLLIAIVLAISAGTWLAAPAFAAVSITVNKTEGLNPKGETVKVEGAGFKPGIQLYLVTCNPAIPSGGACDLANFPGPVDVKPDGTWSASLKVVAKFGTVDCFKTACAIQTSRVGRGLTAPRRRTRRSPDRSDRPRLGAERDPGRVGDGDSPGEPVGRTEQHRCCARHTGRDRRGIDDTSDSGTIPPCGSWLLWWSSPWWQRHRLLPTQRSKSKT